MKKLIYVFLSLSLSLGVYAADKNKDAAGEKPAKADKADKADKKDKKAKKGKGEEVTVVGALKCGHCDFKIGDKCAAVLKTEKKFKGNESRLYFLKGKPAKTFAKQNPKAEKVEASGLARKDDEHFVLKVAKIALKE